METVIKEHNLDIETLMSSRLPMSAGTQVGETASQQLAGKIFMFFATERRLHYVIKSTNWCELLSNQVLWLLYLKKKESV